LNVSPIRLQVWLNRSAKRGEYLPEVCLGE